MIHVILFIAGVVCAFIAAVSAEAEDNFLLAPGTWLALAVGCIAAGLAYAYWRGRSPTA